MRISACLCFKSPHLIDEAEKDFLTRHSQNPQETESGLGTVPPYWGASVAKAPFLPDSRLGPTHRCWAWKARITASDDPKSLMSLLSSLTKMKQAESYFLSAVFQSEANVVNVEVAQPVPEKAPLTHAFFDLDGNRESSLTCSGNHTNTVWAFARQTGISSRVALWEKTGLKWQKSFLPLSDKGLSRMTCVV